MLKKIIRPRLLFRGRWEAGRELLLEGGKALFVPSEKLLLREQERMIMSIGNIKDFLDSYSAVLNSKGTTDYISASRISISFLKLLKVVIVSGSEGPSF